MLKCAENDTKNPPLGGGMGAVLVLVFTHTPPSKFGSSPPYGLIIVYRGVL